MSDSHPYPTGGMALSAGPQVPPARPATPLTGPGKERLIALDHAHVWHPFTQMQDWLAEPPLIIERGQGVILYDVDGQPYYDATSSIWLNVHGHRRAEIDQAIVDQLGRVAHSTLLGLANVPSIELAARLAAISPPGLTRVFYSDNGSTAVEIALKMAFQYWQHKGRTERRLFISMENAYHGDTLGAVSVGAIPTFHGVFEPLLFDVIRVPYPDVYRHPSGDPAACAAECLEGLRRAMAQYADQAAALIVEPLVQAAAGIVTMPPGFLRSVREMCRQYGVLFIADEVATGFGRTGHMFACEHEDVAPDIMAIGKGLTGGYLPLAATVVTEEIFAAFLGPYEARKTFFHGHSYTGNPLACAAALASLAIFERDGLLGHVRSLVDRLGARLASFWDLPHVGDVRQVGLIAGIELAADRRRRLPYAWGDRIGHRVAAQARRRGLILRPIGNVLVFMPPLVTSAEELDAMLDILREAIAAETDGRAA